MKHVMLSSLFCCLFLGLFTTSCSEAPPPIDQEAVKTAILGANQEFANAYNSGDAAGVAARYTPDAIILPPNSKIVQGSAGIEGFWKGAMEMGIAKVDLQTTEVQAGSDFVVETGKALLYTADGQQVDEGKYMVWWKKDEGGQWKMHRDIWNSDLQPPPPAEASVEEM